MKKIITALIATALVLSTSISVFAFSTNEEKDTTLGEIQNSIEKYFEENNIEMEIESDEFYEYVLNEILDNGDAGIKELHDYKFIIEFMTEFKNAYSDYLYCRNSIETLDREVVESILETNDCVTYDSISKKFSFKITDRFKDMTINDIVFRNNNSHYSDSVMNKNYLNHGKSINSYSPNVAANYARNNASGWNVMYPYYSGADCTNFVSQCLYAGGLPMNGSNNRTGIYNSTSRWYCKCTFASDNDKGRKYAVTTSWIRVSDFNKYWTSRAFSKTKKTSATNLNSSCNVGDVVQLLSPSGTPQHTVIISKKVNGIAYYCGHSNTAVNKNVSNLFNGGSNVLLFDLT